MTHKKLNLPEKICNKCKKIFNWRKKWERDWDNISFCSKKCKNSYSKLS